jgi:hypothetical protein
MTLAFPTQDEFDVSRAILRKHPSDQPVQIENVLPLADALASGAVAPETSLQVAEINGQPRGFVTRELLLFDAAQGADAGQPWVATFCMICNAGALFSPRIGEQTYHFVPGGIYNAMAILRDVESDSFWNVIDGQCLHGPARGRQLQRVGTLRHMLARDAVIAFPDMLLTQLRLTDVERSESEEEDAFRRAARPEWSSRLAATLAPEDTRLPRLDMGLGVWTARSARYYPFTAINARDDFAFDVLDGRGLLIYIDRESRIPDAFYTSASAASWYGDVLKLNNGLRVQHGAVFDSMGDYVKVERPLQLFQRWYGFSTMFRGCEVFGR